MTLSAWLETGTFCYVMTCCGLSFSVPCTCITHSSLPVLIFQSTHRQAPNCDDLRAYRFVADTCAHLLPRLSHEHRKYLSHHFLNVAVSKSNASVIEMMPFSICVNFCECLSHRYLFVIWKDIIVQNLVIVTKCTIRPIFVAYPLSYKIRYLGTYIVAGQQLRTEVFCHPCKMLVLSIDQHRLWANRLVVVNVCQYCCTIYTVFRHQKLTLKPLIFFSRDTK